MSQLDLYRRITELEAENERLRAKLAAAETYGEKERGHFEDWFKRACEAEARTCALEAALRGLPETIRAMKFRPSDQENLVDNAIEMVARKVEQMPLTEPPPPQEEPR